MKKDVSKVKPFVLPGAIVLGLLLHEFCKMLTFIVPYLIFSILLLTFATTDLCRMRVKKLDIWLMTCQSIGAIVLYVLFSGVFTDIAIAEGLMMGALCPVASSVTVVAVILGAKRENTVAYTIFGNLLVCVLAPLLMLVATHKQDTNLLYSFLSVFSKIGVAIGLPFFVMLIMQRFAKKTVTVLSRINGLSFYLWAFALLLTLGQTIDFIFIHGAGHWDVILILGLSTLVMVPLQFYIGRIIGKRYGDPIAGQQLLGQKNTAMGIWISNTYLSPLSSTFMAFYSICQNILNSWQIWRHNRIERK